MPETIRVKTPAVSSVPSTITGFGVSANFETVMFYFDAVNDIDLDSYSYQLYSDSSGTTLVSEGKNKANVFTISVTNSSDGVTKTYYGRVAVVNSAGIVGTYTDLVSSGATPLIGSQYITSLTAAKITTGTIGAAEITLNGANSIIKSSNYSAGSLGWKITGLGDAEFNDLTVRTALDIGGSDASSFHVDVNGNLWLGASTYGSAPFEVSNTGALTATGANISGAINASSGSFTGKITVPGTNTQFGKNINDAANYQGIKVGGLAGEWKNAWVERNDGSVYFNVQNVAGTNRFYMDSTDSLLSMGNGVFSVNNAGAVTASSVTITGGTVGGIASGTASLYFGLNTFANANTPFYVDTSSRFSLGDKLYFDGTNLTVNGGGTFTGTLQVGDVEIGNNVGPGSGHHGVSLSPNNFNNIFLRRESDGVYFFRVNSGGANSLTFDSSSGVLTVTGTINASSGLIGGWTIGSSTISAGGTTISSSGRITIGLASDSALTLNSGSDISMYAASGGKSSIFFYRDGYGGTYWDSKIEQSAAGNFIVYGNDFNGNYYPTLIVRSYAYSGIEARSVDRAVIDDTLAVTRVWTTTAGYNTDIAANTQMIQFFKKIKPLIQ